MILIKVMQIGQREADSTKRTQQQGIRGMIIFNFTDSSKAGECWLQDCGRDSESHVLLLFPSFPCILDGRGCVTNSPQQNIKRSDAPLPIEIS